MDARDVALDFYKDVKKITKKRSGGRILICIFAFTLHLLPHSADKYWGRRG